MMFLPLRAAEIVLTAPLWIGLVALRYLMAREIKKMEWLDG